MFFKIVVCHYSFINLLYITLIFIGFLGLSFPPTSRVLFSDISFDTLVTDDAVDDELRVIEIGTSTTLFQSSDAFPLILASYIAEISVDMLLKVYVLYELL